MFETQELPANDLPASAVPLPAAPSQPVHLLDRLSAIFKHRRIAATAFVLVVTVMMIQTYSTVPIFQAASRVLIQDERTAQVANLNANDPAFWQDADQYYKTQYSILQSRGLARRVVKRLDVAHNPDFGDGPRPHDPISAHPPGARGSERLGAIARLETGETGDTAARRRRGRA